jgi:hypothetical protein
MTDSAPKRRPLPNVMSCIHKTLNRKTVMAMDLDLSKSFAKAQHLNGISLSSFLASISISFTIFAIEVLVFLLIRSRLPAI